MTASTLAAQVADFLETPDLRIIIRQRDAPAALDGSEELLEEEPSQQQRADVLGGVSHPRLVCEQSFFRLQLCQICLWIRMIAGTLGLLITMVSIALNKRASPNTRASELPKQSRVG